MKTKDEFSELKAAALAATQGKWEMGTMPVVGPFGAASHIMSLVINTKGDSNLVHAVAAGVLCTAVTGTGPNSEANARYIATASPAVVLSLLANLEAAQNEIGAKAVERIANVISEAMNELSIIDRMLYARNIRIIQAAAAVIRREASRMRNRKASSYSVNTEDVNIGWLQKASQGDAE